MKNILDGILGLAIGDALGVPVEFQLRSDICKNPVRTMRAYGTHHQPAGTWSDDTSLTLALLDSMATKKTVDYKDIMESFTCWLMENKYTASGVVFDVGNATSRAIMNYGRGMKPLQCGGRSEYENGNGSLMRILPAAYYLFAQPKYSLQEQITLIHNLSSLTHKHSISLVGCGIYVLIALELIKEQYSLEECVVQGLKIALNYYHEIGEEGLKSYERLKDIKEFKRLPETDISSSGYVVDTLEASIWCLLNTTSYRECVLQAVNLGDDTDTVAAVTGGLAGIYYGMERIPEEWKETLARKEYLEKLCLKFQRIFFVEIDPIKET